MKALLISADGFEDMELFYPSYRLKEEGWKVTLAAPKMGVITGKHAYGADVDMALEDVNPEGYDLLIVPGGKAPEEVRLNQDALDIIRWFMDARRPVAAICHGAQALISAGVVKGRDMTCWKGVRDDLIAAGANYHDDEVVVDGNLVTSRMPGDLPAFMRETFKVVASQASARTRKKAA